MQTQEQENLSEQPHQSEVGRAFLVVNGKARQGRENFRIALDELQKQNIRIINAHAVANPRYIKPLIQRALERDNPDTLIVGGGDGTVSLLADLLAFRRVQLGVIPMGTANDFARNLEIPDDIPQAVAIIKDGYVQPVDLGYAGNRYFLNVASIGLGVEVAGHMDQNLKKWLGPLAYGAAAITALNEMRPLSVRLVFKDRPLKDRAGFETVSFKALQVAVANGRYYGGGMVTAPNETIVDGRLSVTVIEAMSGLELMRLAPGLRDGTYVRNPKVHHYTTTDIFIETTRVHKVNLDGEVCQRTPLYFKVAPAALKVFTPKP